MTAAIEARYLGAVTDEADDDTAAAHAFGTAAPDAPVTRAELERALRGLHVTDLVLRDTLLQLAARVVALTDELARRLDPATPDAPLEPAIDGAIDHTLAQIRAADGQPHVEIDLGPSKYDITPVAPPCDELLAICKARCCTFRFALSTTDLDEGVLRWDYGQPYLIRQRASDGYCVHNDPASHTCSVHAVRPRVCRVYDCREDKRVWTDFERRVLATYTPGAPNAPGPPGEAEFDLLERARRRGIAVWREQATLAESFADAAPRHGPPHPKR